MSKKEKLLKKAQRSPENLSFKELCACAELAGFEFKNQTGSHRIYKHPTLKKIMNFQPDKRDKSKAKQYQIRQLMTLIETLSLIQN